MGRVTRSVTIGAKNGVESLGIRRVVFTISHGRRTLDNVGEQALDLASLRQSFRVHRRGAAFPNVPVSG